MTFAGRPNPLSSQETKVLKKVYPLLEKLSYQSPNEFDAIYDMLQQISLSHDRQSNDATESRKSRLAYDLSAYMRQLSYPQVSASDDIISEITLIEADDSFTFTWDESDDIKGKAVYHIRWTVSIMLESWPYEAWNIHLIQDHAKFSWLKQKWKIQSVTIRFENALWKPLKTYTKSFLNDNEPDLDIPKISDDQFAILTQHLPAWALDNEILLLEFTDLQCPFCQRFERAGTLEELSKEQWVWTVTLAFPLSFHPQAFPAAVATNCVHRYAWYEAAQMYKSAVMETWLGLASDVIDVLYEMNYSNSYEDNIFTCVENQETAKAVQQQMDIWRNLWITWTPGTLVVHVPTQYYKKVSWAVPASSFTWVIDAMQQENWESIYAPIPTVYYPSKPDAKPQAPSPQAPKVSTVNQEKYDVFMEGRYVKWKKDARLTIIEFSDVQCPFCQRHANNGTLDQVLAKYAGDVNVAFGHFPLSFHVHAQMAWEAIECAGKLWGEEGYYAFKTWYFAAWWNSNKDIALDVAEEVWLSVTDMDDCIESWEFTEKVKSDMTFGQSLWVTWTPGNILIDNVTGDFVKVSWAVSASAFDAPIQSFLE